MSTTTRIKRLGIALSLLAAAVFVSGQSVSGTKTTDLGKIYISDTGSATVSVIDLNKLELADTIDLSAAVSGAAAQSHFFEITKDGKYIWVGERQGTGDGKILVVDLKTKAVVNEFNVGAAIGQTISRDGKWIFTVSNGKGSVGSTDYNNVINVFDVEHRKYLGTIPHGSAPHVLETTADSKTLWTTTAGGGHLVSYDISGLPGNVPQRTKKDIDVKKLLVDAGAFTSDTTFSLHALVLHPDGKHAIVGSFTNGLTTGGGDIIVNIEDSTLVARIPGRPHNYDISADGRYLLSGESNAPDCEEAAYLPEHKHAVTGPLVRVVAIDALSHATPDPNLIVVEKTIDSGSWGYGGISHQAYDPSGKYIIITTSKDGNGKAVIVDAGTLVQKADITVGKVPHGITVPGHGR
jgi:DNA-binding beta-propeller fold protein YncE